MMSPDPASSRMCRTTVDSCKGTKNMPKNATALAMIMKVRMGRLTEEQRLRGYSKSTAPRVMVMGKAKVARQSKRSIPWRQKQQGIHIMMLKNKISSRTKSAAISLLAGVDRKPLIPAKVVAKDSSCCSSCFSGSGTKKLIHMATVVKVMAKKTILASQPNPNPTMTSFDNNTPDVSPRKVSPYHTLNCQCSVFESKCELNRIWGNTMPALHTPARNMIISKNGCIVMGWLCSLAMGISIKKQRLWMRAQKRQWRQIL